MQENKSDCFFLNTVYILHLLHRLVKLLLSWASWDWLSIPLSVSAMTLLVGYSDPKIVPQNDLYNVSGGTLNPTIYCTSYLAEAGSISYESLVMAGVAKRSSGAPENKKLIMQ